MMNAGIRAFVGKLSMDKSTRPTYMEPSADASLAAVSSFVGKCIGLNDDLPEHMHLIHPVLTPRFVPTCSDKLLTGLGHLSSERKLRVQSHMAEAHDQVAWVRAERGVEDMEVFERVIFSVTSLHKSLLTRFVLEWSPHIPHCTSALHLPRSTFPEPRC